MAFPLTELVVHEAGTEAADGAKYQENQSNTNPQVRGKGFQLFLSFVNNRHLVISSSCISHSHNQLAAAPSTGHFPCMMKFN